MIEMDCQTSQSPINLQPRISAKEELDLTLHWKRAQGIVRCGNNGLEIIFPPCQENYASLNGKRYLLRDLHFHHPAEHFLDGRLFDGELHIVHQNLDDLTYLVIGVFLRVEGDDATAPQMQFADALSSKPAEVFVNPENWLPIPANDVIRYEGSLTTKPYTETVSWAVTRHPLTIPRGAFDAIVGCSPPNARNLQPVNRRFVVQYAGSSLIAHDPNSATRTEEPSD